MISEWGVLSGRVGELCLPGELESWRVGVPKTVGIETGSLEL